MEEQLRIRSGSSCELCTSTTDLNVYVVSPKNGDQFEDCALVCAICQHQIEHPDSVEVNHWRCLNDSMWSAVPAVQVLAWRMLSRLSAEGWPQDLFDMLYLDEETLKWAKAVDNDGAVETEVNHLDSNGAKLESGDTVVLIKDLNVKGANFVAKRGTAVKSISLVADNSEHVEGKISGQQIVILTKFVKKSS